MKALQTILGSALLLWTCVVGVALVSAQAAQTDAGALAALSCPAPATAVLAPPPASPTAPAPLLLRDGTWRPVVTDDAPAARVHFTRGGR